MFERFTDRARRVVVLAQEESRQLRHNYIGTEHLLLGLMKEEDGLAARALAACGLGYANVRQEVESRVGQGTEAPQGHIPFTPRAKKVLEFSLRQALQLGHNYIGTEHILLGLLREGEGVAAQILLTEVDGGLEKVRDQVLMLLDIPREKIEQLRVSGVPLVASGTRVEDEIRKRLEAIEARLSVIEQLLREQQGGEEVS